jgi:hypothetical protein
MANYNDYLEYLKHIDNTTEKEIKTKIDGLNNDITHLKDSLGKLNTVKDDLTNKLNEANNKINENFNIISIKETEITSLESDISDFTLKLKATKEEISKLEKQKSKDEKKSIENSEQTNLLNEKYNKIQNEYEAAKEIIKKHFVEIQNQQSRLGIAEKNAENLNSIKNDLESRIQKYIKEIDSLNSTVENLKNTNDSDTISSLEAKISTSSKNIKQLEIDKTRLGNELMSSQEYAKQLNKTLSEKNEQLKSVEPKGKLKYILGAFSILFLITSIYYYSKYNNLQSKYGYLDYKNSSDSKIEEAATMATDGKTSDTVAREVDKDTLSKVAGNYDSLRINKPSSAENGTLNLQFNKKNYTNEKQIIKLMDELTSLMKSLNLEKISAYDTDSKNVKNIFKITQKIFSGENEGSEYYWSDGYNGGVSGFDELNNLALSIKKYNTFLQKIGTASLSDDFIIKCNYIIEGIKHFIKFRILELKKIFCGTGNEEDIYECETDFNQRLAKFNSL